MIKIISVIYTKEQLGLSKDTMRLWSSLMNYVGGLGADRECVYADTGTGKKWVMKTRILADMVDAADNGTGIKVSVYVADTIRGYIEIDKVLADIEKIRRGVVYTNYFATELEIPDGVA